MPGLLRAVLDTNVLLAARMSGHPASPNVEVFDRWQRDEFRFLYSLDTLAEYAEKLLARGLPSSEVESFLRLLAQLGEVVPVVFFHFRHYPWTRTTSCSCSVLSMAAPLTSSVTISICCRFGPTTLKRSQSANPWSFWPIAGKQFQSLREQVLTICWRFFSGRAEWNAPAYSSARAACGR